MPLEDWKGILIPTRKCAEAYRRIFIELGIADVVELERQPMLIDEQEEARKVGDITKSTSKKVLIIGLDHHLMTYTPRPEDNSIDYIYFDAHSDDWENNIFGCGSFINYMKGRHYVVGIADDPYPEIKRSKRDWGNKTTWFRHSEANKIIEIPFRDKIFLSYDIDVFDSSVTTAHDFGGGRMLPEQVKDLSNKIVKSRHLVGINIAEYRPSKEAEQNYKTVDVIVDLLLPLL
jgi:arginase family enzyme